MTRIVFADCETVRIKPGPATIWELAVICRDPAASDDETWLWQIRPDLAEADPMALKVGGYYDRCSVQGMAPGTVRCMPVDGDGDQSDYSSSGELARSLVHHLDGTHLVAANPQFDAGHLEAFLRANGECLTADYHYTDLGSLVRGSAAAQGIACPWPLKVACAAELVGLDPDDYEAHTALGDARMGRDIFDRVMGGGA